MIRRGARASEGLETIETTNPISAMVSFRDPLGHKLLQVPEISILNPVLGEMSGGVVKILSA